MPPAKKTAAPKNDKRPDDTLVQVVHSKEHGDLEVGKDISPGVVSLGWLRLTGYDKGWVEVAEATDEQEAAINGGGEA